jgi:diguanylate cyclase (GGDEF)-like protein/PAS domain S-box-containing protein
MRPSALGARVRVAGAFVLVLVPMLLLATQQTLQLARQNAEAALRLQADAALGTLSGLAAEAAVARDYRALEARIGEDVEAGRLRSATFSGADGLTVSRRLPASRAERPEWFARVAALEAPLAQQAIVVGGIRHGALAVQPSTHAHEDFLWQLGTRLALLISLATAALGWLTHRLLTPGRRDLAALQAAAHRVGQGDCDVHLPVRSGSPSELQDTVRAFNGMSAALSRLLADLREQRKALDSTFGVIEADPSGAITHANPSYCILSGYTRAELVGRHCHFMGSGVHDGAFFAGLWDTLSGGRTWRGELCNRARDGRLFWTWSTILPIAGDDGKPVKYLSVHLDITRSKQDEAALSDDRQRWQITLQSINDAVIVTDAFNRVDYLNPTAESLLGLAYEEAQSRALKDLIQLDSSGGEDGPVCFMSAHPPRHGRTGSTRLRTRLGQCLDVSFSCAPLAGRGSSGAIYVLRDETEKRQLLDSMREMAFHDTLTKLPNRRAVEGRLARALRTARDADQQHAFCYIDLDQFKLVNDTCGHAVGDALLMDIAQTMKDALPGHAYLGRLGGDEFGLILFDTLPADAIEVCRQLVQRIRDFRFEHKGRRFTLGACAGVAPIAQSATTAGDLMVQADMACYRAKSEGSGRVLLYEADEVGFRRLETEMGWAADFAQALEGNQFLPYRQLIQPARPGGQAHYEVLIRWQRNGVVEGPAKLLPALERYGQAPILDRWMVEAVISYLAAHPDERAVYFINLSGKTVADETFLGTVCHLLDHFGVDGERVGFEVTETAAVVNLEDAQRLIQGLRQRGCQFALDDFGRDASSFFYLKHLPADFLKIDGAFVRGMLHDRRDQSIVRSIAQLASDFGMHSVAEQVEDADMAALLRDMGVDYLQGYHVHRPEPLPRWAPSAGTGPHARAPATPRPPHLTLVG